MTLCALRGQSSDQVIVREIWRTSTAGKFVPFGFVSINVTNYIFGLVRSSFTEIWPLETFWSTKVTYVRSQTLVWREISMNRSST